MRRLGIVFLCLAALLCRAQVGRDKLSRPDVFLVTIDTLRADHVRCYGDQHIATPSLDLLAHDGILFLHAFTPSPITNTSHVTILTGLLPSTHGVTDFAIPLTAAHPTWAELLRNQGYKTAAFIGAVILDSKTLAPGLDRGFDFYDNFPQQPSTKSRWGRIERRGLVVVSHAENWLESHRAGSRFLWLHLYDPHDPYQPPPPYSRLYKDRLYDGEIAYADSALGHFFAYLKKTGAYDRSLILVVGDHGEGLGEHHEDTHGIFLYDSTTHVPLILKLPGEEKRGKQVSAQVRTTDILPTIVDLLGVAAPEHLDGESLKAYFAGDDSTNRPAFGETDYPLRFGWAPLRSIRDSGFKFIEAPRPEFYDLAADPRELENRYIPWDASVQKLRASLAQMRAQLPKPDQSSPGAVGKATTDELRALGYLGPADALSTTNVPEPSLLPDPKDKIEEQNLLHTAMLASEDGRPKEARSALEKVLEMDPNSPTALLQLGQLELVGGQSLKAADHLQRARKVRPNDASAALSYGQALEQTGDLMNARQAVEASLKLNPMQFTARFLLGRIELKMNDAHSAQDQFEAALLLEPKSFEAHLFLARTFLAEKRFSDAACELESLLRSHSADPEVHQSLAEAYRGLGKKRQAAQQEGLVRALRQ